MTATSGGDGFQISPSMVENFQPIDDEEVKGNSAAMMDRMGSPVRTNPQSTPSGFFISEEQK